MHQDMKHAKKRKPGPAGPAKPHQLTVRLTDEQFKILTEAHQSHVASLSMLDQKPSLPEFVRIFLMAACFDYFGPEDHPTSWRATQSGQ